MNITVKKLLAVIISVFMIISVVPVAVFASDAPQQGTAITDAAGFAAMTADGTYYLAEDITVTETYQTEFKGTFNGNGKTITASTTLFDKLMDATVENFTVASLTTVTLANGGGMVCNTAGGNTVLRDIKNTASLKSTNAEKAHSLAGIVGDLAKGSNNSTITIIGCVNTGNISAQEKQGNAGGIVGGGVIESGTYNVLVEDCSNSGNITGKKSGGVVCLFDKLSGSVTLKNCQNLGNVDAKNDLAGGIIGQVTKSIGSLEIYGCVNSGDVSTTNKYVAGIIGICQMEGSTFECSDYVLISHCFNSGNTTTTNTGCYSGGIIGRFYGGIVEYCGNTGNIQSGKHVAGIIGGASTGVHTIRYCYNTGSVSGHSYSAGINALSGVILDEVYGCYNSGTISFVQDTTTPTSIAQIVTVYKTNAGDYHDNYYVEGMKYNNTLLGQEVDMPCYAKGALSSGYEIITEGAVSYNKADLSSGKLAYDINTSAGKTVYFQKLTGTSDANPSLDTSKGTVIKSGDRYLSISIATENAAAIKLDSASGLKFNTTINKNDYDALIASGISADSITYGTVITFNSYVEAVEGKGGSFTMSDFDEMITDGTSYIKDAGSSMVVDGDSYVFSGSVLDIASKNYSREYSAIGYLKIGDVIVYSGDYVTRNVADVAEAAYTDRAPNSSTEYGNQISASSANAINATESYSAYTEAQLTVIKSLYNAR